MTDLGFLNLSLRFPSLIEPNNSNYIFILLLALRHCAPSLCFNLSIISLQYSKPNI